MRPNVSAVVPLKCFIFPVMAVNESEQVNKQTQINTKRDKAETERIAVSQK